MASPFSTNGHSDAKINGYEATQSIRATAAGESIAIIALTAQASRDDRTLALTAGCNDYLSKPFNENELLNKIAEYLGLEYVYAQESEGETEINTVQTSTQLNAMTVSRQASVPTLTSSDLQVMPPEWLAELQKAARYCDDDEVVHLIAQIPPHHTTLSAGLSRLVHNFQFKQIVQLSQTSFPSMG